MLTDGTHYPRDEYGDPRDYAMEARMMLKGLTGILPTLEHLRSLEEYYEIRLITILNELERMRQKVIHGP
jgi:hypothetical protein